MIDFQDLENLTIEIKNKIVNIENNVATDKISELLQNYSIEDACDLVYNKIDAIENGDEVAIVEVITILTHLHLKIKQK